MPEAAAELRRIVTRLDHVARTRPLTETLRMALDKAFVYASAPYFRSQLDGKSFNYRGKSLPYFVSQYNATWRNERMVEIPIALDFLRGRPPGPGLEVGNVLRHYTTLNHAVVDLYERDASVINVDILSYLPPVPLAWIVMISTLEHIGWDEDPRAQGAPLQANAGKLTAVVEHLRSHLAADGRMLITCPLGYNPILDAAVEDGTLMHAEQTLLERTGSDTWTEATSVHHSGRRPLYDQRRRAANIIWVAEFSSGP